MTWKYEGVTWFLFLHEKDATPPAGSDRGARQAHRQGIRAGVLRVAVRAEPSRGSSTTRPTIFPAARSFRRHELFELGVESDQLDRGVVHTAGALPMGPTRQSPRYCGICRVSTTEKPLSVMAAIGEAFGRGR